MGVLKASSLFMNPGEAVIGLSSSEGNVPEAGVCKDDAVLGLLSKPAAAMVAVAVAEAIVACRCVGNRKRPKNQMNESATTRGPGGWSGKQHGHGTAGEDEETAGVGG